jgi:hypothetical protein
MKLTNAICFSSDLFNYTVSGSEYTGCFEIIVGVSVAYNFQTGNNKIKTAYGI